MLGRKYARKSLAGTVCQIALFANKFSEADWSKKSKTLACNRNQQWRFWDMRLDRFCKSPYQNKNPLESAENKLYGHMQKLTMM